MAVLFVNKQKEEVMTELGAPATLSYFSSPGLRGCDVMRLARRRVLHLPRHFLMAWHLHSRIMISNPGHEQYRPLFMKTSVISVSSAVTLPPFSFWPYLVIEMAAFGDKDLHGLSSLCLCFLHWVLHAPVLPTFQWALLFSSDCFMTVDRFFNLHAISSDFSEPSQTNGLQSR